MVIYRRNIKEFLRASLEIKKMSSLRKRESIVFNVFSGSRGQTAGRRGGLRGRRNELREDGEGCGMTMIIKYKFLDILPLRGHLYTIILL
jgi:hypothetical protein